MRSSKRFLSSFATAAALWVAAVVVSQPAFAQRLSLSERIDKLEQQANSRGGAQANIELVNQISSLQSQVQALQGQNEELKHQLDEMRQRNKDQYIDLDSRIGRLEGRSPGAAPPPAGAAASNAPLQDIQLGANGSDAGTSGAGFDEATSPTRAPPEEIVSTRPPVSTRAEPPVETAPPPRSRGGDPASEKAAYDEAFNALKDGRYAESSRRFQAFVDQYPNGELTGNAYYWLGESYYATQNYRIALDTFGTLLKRYPQSQKAPDALLKVGYCQYEMRQWDQAEATLSQVVAKYPDTTIARLAQGRLRALKLERH